VSFEDQVVYRTPRLVPPPPPPAADIDTRKDDQDAPVRNKAPSATPRLALDGVSGGMVVYSGHGRARQVGA
jgi:hypothetical protein